MSAPWYSKPVGRQSRRKADAQKKHDICRALSAGHAPTVIAEHYDIPLSAVERIQESCSGFTDIIRTGQIAS